MYISRSTAKKGRSHNNDCNNNSCGGCSGTAAVAGASIAVAVSATADEKTPSTIPTVVSE